MPWALLNSLELCSSQQLRMNVSGETYRGLSIKEFLILQVPKDTFLLLLFLQVPFMWTEMKQE